jgi:hypothetical protein
VTDRDLVVMLGEDRPGPGHGRLPGVQAAPDRRHRREPGGRRARDARGRRAGCRSSTERRLIGIVTLDDVLVGLGREMSDVEKAIRSEISHEREVAYIRERLATARR